MWLSYFLSLKDLGKKILSARDGICFFIWKFMSFPVPFFA